MKHILLASNSPRRKWLLEDAGYTLTLVKSTYEETNEDEGNAYQMVMEQSLGKAKEAILTEEEKELIEQGKAALLTADTIVILDGKILGKPVDEEDAKVMLRLLSGRTHEVATGVTLHTKEEWDTFYVVTTICFQELREEQIEKYVVECQPLDKCGAYGLHELDESWIKEVDGSSSNVIGLPMEAVTERLAML